MTEFQIKDISEKNTPTGKQRYQVETSIGRMWLWDTTLAEDILDQLIGEYVEGTFKNSPYGNNLISIEKKLKTDAKVTEVIGNATATQTAPPSSPPSNVTLFTAGAKPTIPYVDRERLIVRQACLKASVEMPRNTNVLTSIILADAEEFEKWVFRND